MVFQSVNTTPNQRVNLTGKLPLSLGVTCANAQRFQN